jgi:predicted MFS family arabinose efflux permease
MLSPIWALAIAVFAVGMDTYIVVGVLPEVARDLDEPIAAVGLIASAYALPTALLAPVFGPLSDRRGRRTALLLGLSVFVVSAAASTLAPNLMFLLATRAVNGLGAAILLPAAYAYAGDLPLKPERDRAMGVLASAFPMATLLGLPLGAIAATFAGWRGALALITIFGLLALLLVRAILPADGHRADKPAGYLASYRSVLSDRGGLVLLTVTFVWFIAPMGLFTYFAQFIHVTYDVPTTQAGLSLIVIGAVGAVASRVSGRMMGVIGARNAVLYAISAFGLATVLMVATTGTLWLSIAVMGLWASGTWFGMPAIQAIVAAHSERLRGTMLAFNSSAFNLAGVAGPALIGVIVASSGFEAAYRVGTLLAVGAFALAWLVLPRGTRIEADKPVMPELAGD